jgi:hypothetical protein
VQLYKNLTGVIMLADRKALIEQELRTAQAAAANMYRSIAIVGDDVHSQEYRDLTEKISNLSTDLSAVNQLIAQGNK